MALFRSLHVGNFDVWCEAISESEEQRSHSQARKWGTTANALNLPTSSLRPHVSHVEL